MFLEFENLKFCKTVYRLSCYQVSILLVVWIKFYEGQCKTPKHHYDVIYSHCVSKLAYFIEHGIGYQPSKFECTTMSGSNFMDGGGTPPPSATTRLKSPVLIELNFKNASVSHCFRNSSLTIIWNNLDLSNYNRTD